MAPPLTVWDSQADDDDPIAYVYDASGTIQHRIYRQHTGAETGRKIVWFCDCRRGNMYGMPRSVLAGDDKKDTRCEHLRRFMDEASAGLLGPGLMLTEYGRQVADSECQCNTGRRLEESPLPPRPQATTSAERRKARREAERIEEAAAKARAEQEAREAEAREAEARAEAERKAAEIERWKVLAQSMGEAMRLAAEAASKRKRSKAKPAKKSPAKSKKKAAPKKAPAKKTSKAKSKKRGKR